MWYRLDNSNLLKKNCIPKLNNRFPLIQVKYTDDFLIDRG